MWNGEFAGVLDRESCLQVEFQFSTWVHIDYFSSIFFYKQKKPMSYKFLLYDAKFYFRFKSLTVKWRKKRKTFFSTRNVNVINYMHASKTTTSWITHFTIHLFLISPYVDMISSSCVLFIVCTIYTIFFLNFWQFI